MNKLDEWARDKPIVIALISQQIAFSAVYCYQALKAWKSGESIGDYRQPSKIKEWIGFYKEHRKILEYFKRTLCSFNELGEIGAFISDLLQSGRRERRKIGSKKYNKKLRKEIENLSHEEWNEIKAFWEKVYRISLDDLKSDLNDEYEEELSRKIKEALKGPEMLFFLRVWVPCWSFRGNL